MPRGWEPRWGLGEVQATGYTPRGTPHATDVHQHGPGGTSALAPIDTYSIQPPEMEISSSPRSVVLQLIAVLPASRASGRSGDQQHDGEQSGGSDHNRQQSGDCKNE